MCRSNFIARGPPSVDKVAPGGPEVQGRLPQLPAPPRGEGRKSGQLDLGRLQDELVLPLGRGRQLDLLDTPALMLQRAAERRLPRDVAGEPNRRGVEAGRHLD